MLYHFARDIEIDSKNFICNNHVFHDYIDSVIEKWNFMFRMIDLSVGNATDQKINLSAKSEEIHNEYSEKFSSLINGGVNYNRKKNFLKSVSNILTLSRVNEVKMRKEALKIVYTTLESVKNFPFIESEKSFFINVLETANNEILDKMMG